MLDYLRIRGLALIDDLVLELGQGMNVLTGETGAGKSMIVGSLALLRGARGRSEMVREGFDSARVEAQFNLAFLEQGAHSSVKSDASPVKSKPSGGGNLREALDASEIELDEGALVAGRSVAVSGRSRSHVQDKLTTRGVLEKVGEHLIDICSQHEHHSLTRVSRHIELLDDFGVDANAQLDYGERYRAWRGAERKLRELQNLSSDRLERADYLRFQLDEVSGIELDAGDHEANRDRLVFLRDAQRWLEFADEARDELYDSERSICGRLTSLLDRARTGKTASLREICDQLESAKIACEEASGLARQLAHELDIDGSELRATEDRVHELERLRRKHGCSVEELAGRFEAMQRELESLDNYDAELAEAEQAEASARELCEAAAFKLRQARSRAGEKLAAAIEAELEALHIRDARFRVALHELSEPGPRGLDDAEFLFSANPGEALGPLHKVASGGELSRVLLAIKSVLSTGDRVVTYVFDEVDSGVGGAVAESIGRRLQATSRERQVLCITHLPQIAAFADAHYKVAKRTRDGRTVTSIVQLSSAERVEELARMLGGARITESAREHAAALLKEAKEVRAAVSQSKVAKSERSKSKSNKSAKSKSSAATAKSGRKDKSDKAKKKRKSGRVKAAEPSANA